MFHCDWSSDVCSSDLVKPIRIIVTSSPGTADDFFARALGEQLGEFYRQRVIIENRARSEERRVGKEGSCPRFPYKVSIKGERGSCPVHRALWRSRCEN